MSRRLLHLVLFVAFALVGAPACSSAASRDTAGSADATRSVTDARRDRDPGGTLVVAIDAESPGFDPHADAFGHAGNMIARAVFDPLAAYGADGRVHPYLAASITANRDATVWTIGLRQGVMFHDGTPLDADALALNLRTAKRSSAAGAALMRVSSIEVIDEVTVQLVMNEPWAAFDDVLTASGAVQIGYVAAPAMLTDPDGSRQPIGTGPFRFESWRRDDTLTVVRNDSYWRDAPLLDGVEFRVVTDPTIAVAALRQGEIDLLATADRRVIEQFTDRAAAGRGTVILAEPGQPEVIALNTTRPPLDDVTVRQALSLAIDRRRVRGLLDPTGQAELMSGPYASTSVWYHPTGGERYDPDAARHLIEVYEATHEPVEIELLGVSNPTTRSLQELIQSMWADAGIETSIVNASQAAMINGVLAGDFDAVGWGGLGAGDPDLDYGAFHSAGSVNVPGFADAQMDLALETGRASPDRATRRAAYATVQKRLTACMPYLWLTSNQWAIIGGERVRNLDAPTLPDGSPARPTTGPRVMLGELWLAR